MLPIPPTVSKCVGPTSDEAGKADSCAGCPNQSSCASGETKVDNSQILIQNRMASVKHKILVLSGKGGVDYLIVDTPPGTSDEHISIVQYLKSCHVDGAVIVTTPQEVSMADVRKEINFCRKTGINILGVVENMSDIKISFSSLLQPDTGVKLVNEQGDDITGNVLQTIREKCPELLQVYLQSNLFKLPESEQGGDDFSNPTNMAKKYNIPYLGKLPMDPNMMRSCEEGKCFLEYFPTQ
eukprot:gene10978-11965_t